MSDLQKKVDRSIRLLRAVKAEEIELSYSGGKDSDVILTLAKMAGINYRAIYKNTTIDPPGTIKHCRDNGVEIFQPKYCFFDLIQKKGFPSRFTRFCCSELKEYKILPVSVQGIRRCESTKRAMMYKEPIICRTFGRKENHVNVILPILEWSNRDVWDFVHAEGIKCHPLYYDDNGKFDVTRRLGCLGCPLQSDRGLSDFIKYPNLVKAWVRAGQKWWDAPRVKPLKSKYRFSNVYDLFVMRTFFDYYNDYILAKEGLFGMLDSQRFLEEYFHIEFKS